MPQIAEAYEQQDWEKIIMLSDSLVKSGETFDDAVIAYSQALMATQNIEKAIEILKTDLDNKSSHNKKHYIYNELGRAYSLLNDFKSSVDAYEEALRISPSYARPMVGLAKLYTQVGDINNALNYYTQSASLFYEHQFKDELLAIGDTMVAIAPENSNSWQVLGKAYELMEDYEKQEYCLTKELKLLEGGKNLITETSNKERFVYCMIELAVAQYNLGKIDECLQSIKWIRENTNNLGDWEEEIQSLESACKEQQSK